MEVTRADELKQEIKILKDEIEFIKRNISAFINEANYLDLEIEVLSSRQRLVEGALYNAEWELKDTL
jgi:regulator of replication initiation timing